MSSRARRRNGLEPPYSVEQIGVVSSYVIVTGTFYAMVGTILDGGREVRPAPPLSAFVSSLRSQVAVSLVVESLFVVTVVIAWLWASIVDPGAGGVRPRACI